MKSIKLNLLSLIAVAGIAFSSCSSDDSVSNRAPNAFDLTEIADGKTGIELQPKLTWEAATDPDGDKLTYQVYLDTENPPSTSIANNLSINMFKVLDNLDPETKYYWMVVAKDIEGNATQSTIASFTTRDMTIAEAIIGKWFYESAEGEPEFTTCEKKSSILFTKDLFLQVTSFQNDEDDENICVQKSNEAATYKFITNNRFEITSRDNKVIWELEVLSKNTLILNFESFNLTLIKE